MPQTIENLVSKLTGAGWVQGFGGYDIIRFLYLHKSPLFGQVAGEVEIRVWLLNGKREFISCKLRGPTLNMRTRKLNMKTITEWRTLDGAISWVLTQWKEHYREYVEKEKTFKANRGLFGNKRVLYAFNVCYRNADGSLGSTVYIAENISMARAGLGESVPKNSIFVCVATHE